ncbi:two-component histidine kinase PhoR [Gordonia effusa NBRC 100432]|uniref:histidine kinase n=1 Tax=Gordonia effusa NBRC 100432 TaxID=1077974 RepID=H0R0Y1_9ACTN|nr:two-component histidine kinase PhoR [Gordonia effusa NBRC 100432]
MTSWNSRVPLRVSLVALTMFMLLLGLAVSGLAVTKSMHEDLIRRTDDGLNSAVATWARPKGPPPIHVPIPLGPRRPPSQYYVQTTGSDGIRTSTNDISDAPDLTDLDDYNVGPVTVGSADGNGPQWRVIKVSNGNGSSIVATPLTDVQATLSRLMWLQLGVGALVVVIIGLLSYLMVRGSLAPLRRVEETAHAIAGGNLNMRVPTASPNTEVGSLATSLNTMLGQIQHAFATTAASERAARRSEEKMRQFVADASHELRTPLTSIKGFAELHSKGLAPDPADAMRRIDAEANRMNLLVSDLLMLARLDQERPIEQQPVDLLMIGSDVVHSARVASPERDISFDAKGVSVPPIVVGDSARLVQVLSNLLRNAIVHTPEDATIQLAISTDSASALVEVIDTGDGLTADEQAQVFDRFYRGDSSRHRTQASGGSGLGLSIVAALIDAHGGTVGVDSTPGAGARFWVRLPLDAPSGIDDDEFDDDDGLAE